VSKLPILKDRIRAALAAGELTYADLAYRVFPEEQFPKAFRYQANGGPPGCYMALSRALREMRGELDDWHSGIGPGHRYVRLTSGHLENAR
jgi:hypothetical protein